MIYLVTKQKELFEAEEYTVITVEESLRLLDSCGVLQYDSETSEIDCHIGKLLCVQFGNKQKDFQIVVDCTTVDILNYKKVLEEKLIVGQNLKFDLQWLYNYGIIPRRVYDTMIVEQLLYLGYPAGIISYSLAAIAERRLNINIDKSIRGQIIWRGLDTSVILYAANDVKWLEDIMWSQLKDCEKKECTVGAKLECDFVPSIAYLEWCGIKLDEEKWREKMRNDQIGLDKAKKALDLFVTSNPSLSKYTYINRQGDLFEGFQTDPHCLVNWSSSRQVVNVAKDLGFNTITQDKKTGEDKDSVLEKHLKGQKGINDEFLDLYFEYQEYAKVVSSFGQSQLNMINPNTGRCHTVYRQLGAASGRMSCGSQNSNTALAKLKGIPASACTYCNFQQLPADDKTRSAFVSEKGNLFCSCDFSALESRLGADIYQEQSMIDEFLYNSGDIHSLVAKACFPELRDKTTKEIKEQFPHLRKKAKPIGFSQQFGGSARAIAQSLGCPLEEAETIANDYNNGFPGIANFKAKGSKAVREKGYVLMCKYTGHKMYWWDHDKWLDRQKSFTREFWEEYRTMHKNTGDAVAMEVKEHFQAASKWDRMALNAPTQNTGICILKTAITSFFNYIVDNDLFNVVKIVALVHDEACIEYPSSMPEISSVLVEHMEEAASKFCKSLPIPAEAAVDTCWRH
jgi:DNA polymerase I-like protein with 3'-5' exonuclease and polymerase domains